MRRVRMRGGSQIGAPPGAEPLRSSPVFCISFRLFFHRGNVIIQNVPSPREFGSGHRLQSMRYFTVAEANALIPTLERILAEIRERMDEVSRTTERLQILDVLWGPRLLAEGNPDFAEGRDLRTAITRQMAEIGEIVEEELNGRGLRFPQGGLEHGLIAGSRPGTRSTAASRVGNR